ncbi:hypothetical protein BDY24DRAFT_332670, partial [Mrakia frigida]|uniref:uncharacterized protein n=1 Tax=Mrakia frigida TaxID=29902 RepID=UPI003FCC16A9
DLDTQPAWTLGDLPRLKTLAKAKEEETLSLTDESFAMKRKIAELQSLMLKADTKMEESARFLRAKDDPDFAKMIRVRQLGPEHTENQQKLRKTTQLVRDRVLQLENHLAVLKKRVGQEKSGSVPMKAPSLDTIARTMRNITVAVNEKTYEIDDLELRLDVLRLTSKKTSSTPSRNQRAST